MRMLQNKIPPPAVALAFGGLMWGSRYVQNALPLDPGLHTALRLVFGFISLAFAATGIFAFYRARTTLDPVRLDRSSKLVTTGIYRLTRNPMYVGLTVLLITWAVHLAVPVSFLGPIAFASFIHYFQILPEERAMESKFGSEYREYKKHVRRWL